ncbi:MAG: type II toxin-antitoxin system RelE/ParE family toxin [Nitrospiraceae bacterium]
MAADKAKSSDRTKKVTYQVRFTPAADRQLRNLDRQFQTQVFRRIEKLADDPRPPGVEKLEGEETIYRVRTGNYRILYTINDKALVVLVIRVGDRKEVYRQLPRL